MEEIFIRNFQPKDYEAICSLMTQLQSHFAAVDKMGESREFVSENEAKEYINQGLKDVQEMNGICFIAEINGKVAGFVQGIIDSHVGQVMHNLGHKKGKDGWIGLLIVGEEYRRQGIGKNLVESMKKYFQENGCDTVRLKVMSENVDAVLTYESLGFVPKEIEMVVQLQAKTI